MTRPFRSKANIKPEPELSVASQDDKLYRQVKEHSVFRTSKLK